MSIEVRPEARLKNLIQSNGPAIGVELPRVDGVDQPSVHIAFAYLTAQGSPISRFVLGVQNLGLEYQWRERRPCASFSLPLWSLPR